MRNLKKVLALALATVMLLGMMAMASAVDYTDEADIAAEYGVAVDVMQAIGVFEGTAGYLNPKSTLSRAEAAKVIAYIGLTKTNASKLTTAGAPFEDVAADHWAAAPIAYAKNMGIIGGVNAEQTIYDPNGTLTGYAYAKMLLGVLGYKAENQGYGGAGWDTKVNLDAMNAGLLNGLTIDLAQNITREQACQMAFNALKATCVYYTAGTSITIGNAAISVGGSLQSYSDEADAYESYKGAKDGKLQLAEKLYPTLKLQAAADTAFGYSTKAWKYGTPAKTVATEKNYTVLATYAGTANTLTENALYEVVGTDDQAVRVYLNGDDTRVDITADKGDPTVIAALGTYKGATVEIVKNNGVVEALVTAATFGKVTEVVEATTMAKRYVKVDLDVEGVGDVKTFETESYAKGDYVLAYVAGGAIKKLATPATVFGTMTQTAKTAGTISTLYVDGAAIPVAGATEREASAVAANDLNKKYTVYMDNGYAVAVIAEAAAKATLNEYVYVWGGGTLKDQYGDPVAGYKIAEVVYLSDGTYAEIKVDNASISNGIFKVTASATAGLKTLVPVADEADKDTAAKIFGSYTKANYTKAANAKYVDGGTKAYFTENTQVLTITETAGVVSGKLTALPAGQTGFGTTSYVIFSETATADIYEAELIVNFAAPAAAAKDLYYVIGTEVGKVYVADAKTTYAQYVAYDVATGEKKTVMVTAEPSTGFQSFTVNEYGAYTFSAPAYGVNGYGADFVADDTIDVYKDYLTVSVSGTPTFADYDASGAVIIDTTTNGKIATIADLNKYDTTAEFSVVYNTSTAKVVAIVVRAYTVA